MTVEFREGPTPPEKQIVTPEELAELNDDELVELIVERTGKPPDVAREFLTILRGEIPPGAII